jgi:hypothetical protein
MEVRQELRNQLHALSVFEAVPSVVARLEMLIETLSQQLKELDAEIKDTIKTEEKGSVRTQVTGSFN